MLYLYFVFFGGYCKYRKYGGVIMFKYEVELK